MTPTSRRQPVQWRRRLAVAALAGWDRLPADEFRRLVLDAPDGADLDTLLCTPDVLAHAPPGVLVTALLAHPHARGGWWARVLSAARLPDPTVDHTARLDRLRLAASGLPGDLPGSIRTTPAGRCRPLWARVPARPHVTLTGHESTVRALAVAHLPDGRTLLASAGGDDDTVRLWDPATGAPVGQPLSCYHSVASKLVTLTLPDGRVLLACSDDYTVQLVDPVTGTRVGDPLTDQDELIELLVAVPLPDGRVLLATHSSDLIRVYDVAGDVRVDALRGLDGGVAAMTGVPLPDGRVLLAVACHDGTVRCWDLTSDGPDGSAGNDHDERVHGLAALPTPEGGCLLLTDTGTEIRCWDPTTGRRTTHPPFAQPSPHAMAVVPMPDGRHLVVASDEEVRLWDPPTGRTVGAPLPLRYGFEFFYGIHPLCAVPLPDGRTLVAGFTGKEERYLSLWDAVTGELLGGPVTDGEKGVSSLVAVTLPDGRVLLVANGVNHTVRFWDPLTGRPVGRSPESEHPGTADLAVVPGPDGREHVLSTGARQARLWDPSTRRPVAELLTGHTEPMSSSAPAPLSDGRVLVATGVGPTLRLWEPFTGAEHSRFHLPHRVTDVRAMPGVGVAVTYGDQFAVLRMP